MKIKPGSSDYFNANKEELVQIKELSTHKKNWFVRKACKMMKGIRKTFEVDMKTNYEARLEAVKKSIEENLYNSNIDRYVDEVVNNCQTAAFTNFKAGLPQLTALLNQSGDFASGLGQHAELNKAINAIKGNKKIEACDALAAMPGILEKVVHPDDASAEFQQFVADLKDQFTKDDFETKKHLTSDLKDITAAMKWEWSKNLSTHALEQVMGEDQQQDIDLIKHIKEWHSVMKTQKEDLLGALPSLTKKNPNDRREKNPIQFEKYYGFYLEQIEEVKKVSKRQMRDVSDKKKMEASLINFLASKVNTELTEAEKAIAPKSVALANSKATLDKSKKDIEEHKSKLKAMKRNKETLTDRYKIRQENLAILKEDRESQMELYKILKSEWKESFPPLETEINNLKKTSTAEISELIDLIKSSKELKEDVKAMKSIYEAKVEWDLINYVYQALIAINDDGDANQSAEIIARCGQIEEKLKDLRKDVEAIPAKYHEQVNFKILGETEEVSHPLAGQKLGEWLDEIKAKKTAAQNRTADITALETALKIKEPALKKDLNPADKLLMAALEKDFDVSTFHDQENSLFAALDVLKSKKDLRDYIVDGKEVFQPRITELIQNDVYSYMQSSSTRPTQIMREVPALALMHMRYRREYKALDESERAELNSKLEEECKQDAVFDTYCADANGIGDKIALIALKEKLNVRIEVHGKVTDADKLLKEGDESLPVIHLFRTSQGTYDRLTEKVPV